MITINSKIFVFFSTLILKKKGKLARVWRSTASGSVLNTNDDVISLIEHIT